MYGKPAWAFTSSDDFAKSSPSMCCTPDDKAVFARKDTLGVLADIRVDRQFEVSRDGAGESGKVRVAGFARHCRNCQQMLELVEFG